MVDNVLYEQWLAVLRDIDKREREAIDTPNALTVRELAAAWGISLYMSNKRVGELVKSGKLRAVRSPRRLRTGMLYPVWAYELVS